MGATALHDSEDMLANPLDLIEQIVLAHDWPFDRTSEREIAAEVTGRWCDYRLYFSWREDVNALHFTCAFDIRVPDGKAREVHSLLALINEKLWLGHFDLWGEEGMPLFRHSLLLRGTSGLAVEQMEDLVDIAVAECE